MFLVVEGVLVSEGEGDDGESGDLVGWDFCVDEDLVEEEFVDEDLVKGDVVDENLVKEEFVKEDWFDRVFVDEGGGGFSGVGVDGEGWIIVDVIVLDIVDVFDEIKNEFIIV